MPASLQVRRSAHPTRGPFRIRRARLDELQVLIILNGRGLLFIGNTQVAVLNGIHKILRKHNLEQECPTKEFQTRKVRRWLAEMGLPALDRLELNLLLPQWELLNEQKASDRWYEITKIRDGGFQGEWEVLINRHVRVNTQFNDSHVGTFGRS